MSGGDIFLSNFGVDASALHTSNIGTDVQAHSTSLDAVAAVIVTAAGTALLDDANASAQRTTLGLGSLATANSVDASTLTGTTLASGVVTSSLTSVGNTIQSADGLFQVGTQDSFSRYQIWNKKPDATLKLGSWQSDGDATNVNSEGIIVNSSSLTGTPIDATNGGYARIKGNRFGLFTVDQSLPYYTGGTYYYRVDDSAMFYKNNSGTDTFRVTRATGNTTIGGTLAVTSTISGSNLSGTNTGDQTAASLGLVIGTDVQAHSASLDSVAAVTVTSAGTALLDDADAAAQRTTLGLGTLATQSGTFSGTSSGTNTGDQSIFSTVAVSGQSNVVADSTSDTLTLVAGTNVTITTDASTDSITISASGGGSTAATPSTTTRSIYFNPSNTQSLTMSSTNYGTPNRQQEAISFWYKKEATGTNGYVYLEKGSSQNLEVQFQSDNKLYVSLPDGYTLVTSATYTDTASWHHVLVKIDTTQATSGDRLQLWHDGVRVTSFTTQSQPTLNYSLDIGATSTIHVGGYTPGGSGSTFGGLLYDLAVFSGTVPSISTVYNFGQPTNLTAATGIFSLLNLNAGTTIEDDGIIATNWTNNGTVTASTTTPIPPAVTGTNTGDQNVFSTIAVSGQSNVVADSTSDTLTLIAGTNVTITTNATTDEITITSTASGGGSLVLLDTQTASSSTSINFDSSKITSTYKEYVVLFTDIVPSANDLQLWARVSTDNGSTIKSGASDYGYSNRAIGVSGTSETTSDGDTKIILDSKGVATGVAGLSGEFRIFNPNSSLFKHCTYHLHTQPSSGVNYTIIGGGVYQGTTAVNYIRLLPSSGNFSSGTFKLFGVN